MGVSRPLGRELLELSHCDTDNSAQRSYPSSPAIGDILATDRKFSLTRLIEKPPLVHILGTLVYLSTKVIFHFKWIYFKSVCLFVKLGGLG